MTWRGENVRIKFGDAPPSWPPIVRNIGLLFAIVMPIFVLAAISGHHNPGIFLAFDGSRLLSFLTYAIIAIEVSYFGVATFLVMRGSPLGLFMLFSGFTYFGMMLSAVFISAFVLCSWQALVLTIFMSAWSLRRLRRVDTSVGEREVQAISDHIIDGRDGEWLLIYGDKAGHDRLKLVLRGKSSAPAIAIEYVGACLVIIFGAWFVPLAVSRGFPNASTVSWLVWLLTAFIFLAARSSVNIWLLRLRAIGAVHSRR